MPENHGTPLQPPADLPKPAAPADAQRHAILQRFRRCCAGPADLALRSAVLAYLTGVKK